MQYRLLLSRGFLLTVAVISAGPLRSMDLLFDYFNSQQSLLSRRDHEQRCLELKSLLPDDAIVHYVSDQKDDSKDHYYYHTIRYLLVPVRIAPGISADCRFVLAHLSDPSNETFSEFDDKFDLVRDFGGGLRLYERAVR